MINFLKTIFELLFRLVPFPTKTGLRKFGNPDGNSPVFVTVNYDLTVRRVAKVLKGLNCYLLVANSRGINVWCAAGGEHFTAREVISVIKTSGISNLVKHRKLILPQFSACAIDRNQIKDKTGWDSSFGPAYAKDIPQYIKNDFQKDAQMSLAQFGLGQRLEMAISSGVAIGFVLFVILWFVKRSLIPEALFLNFLLSFIISIFYFKLPGRPGLGKAISLGIVSYILFLIYTLFESKMFLSRSIELAVFSFIVGVDFGGWSPIWRGNIITGKDSVLVDIDQTKCIGCGTCISVCPKGSFMMGEDINKALFLIKRGCEGCGACFAQCPTGAINVVRGKLRECSCLCRPICCTIDNLTKPEGID